VSIVQGLFSDVLPPQMMDGGGRGGMVGLPQGIGTPPPPVMTQPQQAMVQQPQQAMVQQPPLDLSKIDLSGLNIPQVSDTGMLNFGTNQLQQTTQNPEDYFNQYTEFLSGVQSGDTASKVNRRDDIYNNFFNQTNYRYQGDPAELRASVGLSDVFSMYDNPEVQINAESFQAASQALSGASDPLSVLSNYYGFDIVPTTNEGANYSNARKYGTTEQNMAEFQSIVEPILQKTIPYIQATQGLEYTDALEYAYTHDPMVAALYNQYGVDLYRQTKDGSTYIFDPIAGQEIRTLEVKDAKFKDYLPAIASIALSFTGVPAALGGMFGASGATATAIGQGLVSASTAALGGARGSDVFKAGVLGAAGGYVKGLQATAAELGKAAEAANAAGDVAKAAELTAQASSVASQFELMSTIQNTARAADAIANKDYVGAVLIGLDEAGFSLKDWTANKLSGLAGSGEILGINADDLAVGVNKFAVKMLEGADPEAALRSAVVEYAKAGGSFPDLGIDLPDFDLPDFDESAFFNSIKNSKIVQTILQWGRDFDENVLKKVKEEIEGAGRFIDENVVQPTREKLKDIDIPHPDFDFKKPDFDFEGPDFDFEGPDINFPDLNLSIPSLTGGGADLFGMSGGGGGSSAAAFRDPNLEIVQPAELFGYVDYLQQLTGRPQ